MKTKRSVSVQQDTSLIKNDFFIEKVSAKFVISSVLSMIFLYAASLIDTLIVGAFLGERGLSAMSLVSPVYLIYYTIGATLGIGASIAGSRYLGKGDTQRYRHCFTASSLILLFAAVVMTAVGYIFIDPIAGALSSGNSAEQFTLVKQYLLYYIPGGAFTLLSYIPMYFLKVDGRPKISSWMFGLSAVLNVILSWMFMNPKLLDMGIGGASLATTISMALSGILGLILLLNGSERLRFVRFKADWKLVRRIVVAGAPNGLSNLLESARILLINILLVTVGVSALLPCYTVVRNISDMLSAVIIGISSALIPLVGVFYGERDFVNERSVYKFSMKLGLTVIIPLVLAVCLLSKPLFALFGVSDPTIVNEGILAIPLSCIGLIFAYINTFYTGYLTSVKREYLATVIVVLRLFAALVICAVPLAFTVGSIGIWLSLTLCEVLTFICFLVIRFTLRKRNSSIDKYFLDTSLEKEAAISFSVKNDINDIVYASEKLSEYCDTVGVDARRSMRAGNAIEEILAVLIKYCLGTEKENFADVRMRKVGDDILLRFRYIGKIFDPVAFLHENEGNEEMEDELLGIKMIEKTASSIDFQQIFGANTLTITF